MAARDVGADLTGSRLPLGCYREGEGNERRHHALVGTGTYDVPAAARVGVWRGSRAGCLAVGVEGGQVMLYSG